MTVLACSARHKPDTILVTQLTVVTVRWTVTDRECLQRAVLARKYLLTCATILCSFPLLAYIQFYGDGDTSLYSSAGLTNTMHRVLYIQEILHQIFQHFLPDSYVAALAPSCRGPFDLPDEYCRSDILSLALTCRAFRDPALDMLWWAMDDLTPLFALLRGFRTEEEESGKKIKVIHGSISPKETEVLTSYARRIKLFHFYHHHDIPFTTFLQVIQACNCTYILPSLRYLLCESSLPEIFFLRSPCLRELKVWFTKNDQPLHHFHNLLASLPQVAPQLVGLSLTCELSEEDLESISCFQNLRNLCLYNSGQWESLSTPLDLNTDFIKKLWSSSSRTLSRIELYGDIEFVLDAIACPPLTFPMVEVVNIAPTRELIVSQLSKFFRSTIFPDLQTLELDYCEALDEESSVEEWQELIKSIVHSPMSAKLRSLKLGSTELPTGLALTDIPEIFTLNLESFETDILEELDLVDIKFMGAAWPCLTDLTLSAKLDCDLLHAVGRQFSRLRNLCVHFEPENLPKIDDMPVAIVHPLQRFRIGYTSHTSKPLSDPSKVALFLDRIFPSVKTWSFPNRQGWESVPNILQVLSYARKDQAGRARVMGPANWQ